MHLAHLLAWGGKESSEARQGPAAGEGGRFLRLLLTFHSASRFRSYLYLSKNFHKGTHLCNRVQMISGPPEAVLVPCLSAESLREILTGL